MSESTSILNAIRESLISEESFRKMCAKHFNQRNIVLECVRLCFYQRNNIEFIFNDNIRYVLWLTKEDGEWIYENDEGFHYFLSTDDRFRLYIWPNLTRDQKSFVMKHFDIFS